MNSLTNVERIVERYERKYITNTQLARYVKLNVITEEQYEEMTGLTFGGGDN